MFLPLVLVVLAAIFLYFMWFYNPGVVVYGGAFTNMFDYGEIMQSLRRKWPFATVVILCPQETVGELWWAEPEPSVEDIRFYAQQNRSRDAYWQAHSWTTAVKCET